MKGTLGNNVNFLFQHVLLTTLLLVREKITRQVEVKALQAQPSFTLHFDFTYIMIA